MPESVLVTGAFGLVGSAVVRQLAAADRRVVATDLSTPANRKAVSALPAGVDVRWADLTDPGAVDRLVAEVSPAVIAHLAAVIPPAIYRNAKLARKVNVVATATLVRAAQSQPTPPRFVLASSNAVHGARNPYRVTDLLRADSPLQPSDLYGGHKAEAERHVRTSALDWVVLRLGGVFNVDLGAMTVDADGLVFSTALPTDGRMHGVDVRDVASGFEAATTADVVGEILMIGGDESHHLRQGEAGSALAAAAGFVDAMPAGRPGDPNSDTDWYVTDWMDTARAQQALSFQRHSWPDMLAEIRANAGWKRYPARFISPLARAFLKRYAPYRNRPGQYSDPWWVIRDRWGEPGPDSEAS
ncbi:MAG TPA: NAD(P)-dependent oxidoreductase [Mycobacterium sp.]|nr:NAD(P)-dependent oxidoreductase [Mycobacterium sp.]